MSTATATAPDLTRAVELFHALSDETRLSIVRRLRGGERCVCDLIDLLDAAQSRLSFHMKVLKESGIVTDRKEGRWIHYSLNPDVFAEVQELVGDLKPSRRRLTLDQFVVAEAGCEVVGVAGLETCCDDALLRSVAVDAEWRSKGVGRALVTRAIASAESRGFRALYLLTTTAEHYFPSFGFHAVDRASVPKSIAESDEFTHACPASAVAMERELAAR